MNTYVKTNGELYHHGVLGQKWGVKNGPPYPLKPSAHSAAEKKAGWTKSVGGDAKKKRIGKIPGTLNIDRTDSSVTKKAKKDYNTLSDKEFRQKYKTTKSVYAKRVEKYGDPYKNSPLAQFGREAEKIQKEKGSNRLSFKDSVEAVKRTNQWKKENSQNTGGISARDLARAEASSRRKTKNAAERYKKADADLREKKANKDNSPESREALRNARAEKREAEKRAKEQLRADKGRELYAKGLTVQKLQRREAAATIASIGAYYVGRYLISKGNTKAGVITLAASNAALVGYEVYLGLQQNKLRAYYANS